MIITGDFFDGKIVCMTDFGFIFNYDETETLDDDGIGGQQAVVKTIKSNNINPSKDWKKVSNIAIGYSSDGVVILRTGVEDTSYGVNLSSGNNVFKVLQTLMGFKSRGRRFFYEITTSASFELFDIDMKMLEVPQKRMFNNG